MTHEQKTGEIVEGRKHKTGPNICIDKICCNSKIGLKGPIIFNKVVALSKNQPPS